MSNVASKALERRALELFEQCTEVSPADRPDWIAEVCRDSLDLKRRVLELLASEEASVALRTGDVPMQLNSPPERVGPYVLAEPIGAGGMGDVYKGIRTKGGFKQTVAIKLLRVPVVPEAAQYFIQRFELEQAVLANLNHPNIARLLDGGTFEGKRIE